MGKHNVITNDNGAANNAANSAAANVANAMETTTAANIAANTTNETPANDSAANALNMAGLMQLFTAALSPTANAELTAKLDAAKLEMETTAAAAQRARENYNTLLAQQRDFLKSTNTVKSSMANVAAAMGIDVSKLGIDLTPVEIKTTIGRVSQTMGGGHVAGGQPTARKMVIYTDGILKYDAPGAAIVNSSSGCGGGNSGRYRVPEFIEKFFGGDYSKYAAGGWEIKLPNGHTLTAKIIEPDTTPTNGTPGTDATTAAMVEQNTAANVADGGINAAAIMENAAIDSRVNGAA